MFSPVDQIKERLNIVDVVSAYVTLLPAGKNYKGKSPFKQEKTPSFFVSPDKGLYHCFSTGKGGDMFTFVQEMEGLDFRGALRVLADKAGISLSNWNPKEKEKKDKLYEIMEEATAFFENELWKNKEVLSYLYDRGLDDKTIKDFRIGFAPDGWRNLHDGLFPKFSIDELLLVGLVKKTDRGAYDTFRRRIMFPICDSAGRVIAFSGRIFKDDPSEKSAKYVNSPDTPLFSKSDILFGIDKAKNHIRKYNFTTIVEGQFDLIMLHQVGFKNTVAVSGTALADKTVSRDNHINNLGIVKRLSNNLVLAFDSDVAGFNAAKRSANIAMSLGMDVKVVDIPEGKDPADFLKNNGKDAWSKILKNAEHVIIFQVRKLKESTKDERSLGRKIREEVLPDLYLVDSEIEKSYFIKKISEIAGISEKDIVGDLEKVKGVTKENKGLESVSTPSQDLEIGDELEKEIWGIYVTQGKNDEIKQKIIDIAGESNFSEMENKYKSRESEFVFTEKDYAEGLQEKFNNFKKFHINREIALLKENIKAIEGTGGSGEEVDGLITKLQTLEKERDKINNSRYINN